MSDKRFFQLDDNGCVTYTIVSGDIEGAKAMMRACGAGFGPDGTGIDDANGLEWTEMSAAAVARFTRCHTEDDRGVIAPADANVGDWFSSEW